MTMADTATAPKLQGTIHVKLPENVHIDTLTELFRSFGNLTGHPMCGIQGLDVNLKASTEE
jgi:hypothetical protein